MLQRIYILILALTIFYGCGNTETTNIISEPLATPAKTTMSTPTPTTQPPPTQTSTNPPTEPPKEDPNTVKIIGKITYDRVPVNKSGIGLDYNNIQRGTAKLVDVKLIDGDCNSKNIIAETRTDDNGDYEFKNINKNQNLRVCVFSRIEKDRKYDIEVIDNTNRDAIYAIKSSLFDTQDSKRVDLHAISGWTGYGYTKPRQAAPFAILDSVYQALKKVMSVDKDAIFPKLRINWSIYNAPSPSSSEEGLREGLIGTTYFDGEDNLYILGDEDSDTDEYDDHIIIHEWGHYFEEKFSRADSIGGPHGSEEKLDIRVAFGEGWGNAFSAIATDNPIYFDTMGKRQSDGFYMDIEHSSSIVKGFFSEDSVQSIIYDIYDSNDDGADRLSMGFAPIYRELTTFQKETKAFTSIFTFIKGLEEQNPKDSDKIDTILNSENIAHIDNIYGTNIDQNLYTDIDSDNICTSGIYGYYNKLYNRKYVKFKVYEDREYIIKVYQNNGSGSDPDFGVYKISPFKHLGDSQMTAFQIEIDRYYLSSGEYLLDILDYNGLRHACFTVTIQ